MDAAEVFALAAVFHAGFQLTVTVLVYPALATRSAEDWSSAHARHSRAITPVVALVYAAVVAAGVGLVVDGPLVAGWVAVAVTGTALAITATLAAPLHGRLDPRDDALVRRLLVVDRWRCAAALAGAGAAVVAVWTGS